GNPAAATKLNLISGTPQNGFPVGTSLTAPFVVRAVDPDGNGVGGVIVNYAITSGAGSMSQPNVTTDAQGFAQSTLTLGPKAGANVVTPNASSTAGPLTLVPANFTFSASSVNGAPAQIFISSGNNQPGGTAGKTLTNPLVVLVTDSFGNHVGAGQASLFFTVT